MLRADVLHRVACGCQGAAPVLLLDGDKLYNAAIRTGGEPAALILERGEPYTPPEVAKAPELCPHCGKPMGECAPEAQTAPAPVADENVDANAHG